MRRNLLALLLVAGVAGGCGTGPADDSTAVGASPSSPPSSGPAVRQPRFADLTQGSTTSVVKLHAYDPANASAVVEPMIFMTGDAYCKAFRIKRSDGRCVHHAYVTEESHTKVTVPLAADVDYFTWEDPQGDVCIDAPEKGGTCPMTAEQFATWYAAGTGEMVAVATRDGAVTRMAIVYTP